MSESKHTPIPWEVIRHSPIQASDGCTDWPLEISSGEGEDSILYHKADWKVTEADARFIIRACNSYEDLLKACNLALEAISLCDMEVGTFKYSEAEVVLQIATAINKAEGV